MSVDQSTEAYAATRRQRVRLTPQQIRDSFEPLAHEYPPILTLDQAAKLAGLMSSTMKRKISEGKFADCVARGKPLRIWRDGFVEHLFH